MVYPIQKIAEFIKLTRWKKCNFTVTILISKFSPCFCNLSEKPLIKFLKMFYQWSVQKKNKVLLLVADILKKQTWVSRASFEPCETQWHKIGLVYSIIFFFMDIQISTCLHTSLFTPTHPPSFIKIIQAARQTVKEIQNASIPYWNAVESRLLSTTWSCTISAVPWFQLAVENVPRKICYWMHFCSKAGVASNTLILAELGETAVNEQEERGSQKKCFIHKPWENTL